MNSFERSLQPLMSVLENLDKPIKADVVCSEDIELDVYDYNKKLIGKKTINKGEFLIIELFDGSYEADIPYNNSWGKVSIINNKSHFKYLKDI